MNDDDSLNKHSNSHIHAMCSISGTANQHAAAEQRKIINLAKDLFLSCQAYHLLKNASLINEMNLTGENSCSKQARIQRKKKTQCLSCSASQHQVHHCCSRVKSLHMPSTDHKQPVSTVNTGGEHNGKMCFCSRFLASVTHRALQSGIEHLPHLTGLKCNRPSQACDI